MNDNERLLKKRITILFSSFSGEILQYRDSLR